MGKPSRSRPAEKPFPRKIPFSITLEGAHEVVLTGDFSGWSQNKIKLTPGGNDEWITTLELPPGEYQYRLIVDGHWSEFPKEARRVPNGFGGTNCVLVVA